MKTLFLLMALAAMFLFIGCDGNPSKPVLTVSPSSAQSGDVVSLAWHAGGAEILGANFPVSGNTGTVAVTVPDTSETNAPGQYTWYLRTSAGIAYARLQVLPASNE